MEPIPKIIAYEARLDDILSTPSLDSTIGTNFGTLTSVWFLLPSLAADSNLLLVT